MTLSKRQVEFLVLAAQGKSRTEAALEASVSPWTVKMYLAEARRALESKNTAQAVTRAISLGIIYVDHAGVAHADEEYLHLLIDNSRN